MRPTLWLSAVLATFLGCESDPPEQPEQPAPRFADSHHGTLVESSGGLHLGLRCSQDPAGVQAPADLVVSLRNASDRAIRSRKPAGGSVWV